MLILTVFMFVLRDFVLPIYCKTKFFLERCQYRPFLYFLKTRNNMDLALEKVMIKLKLNLG